VGLLLDHHLIPSAPLRPSARNRSEIHHQVVRQPANRLVGVLHTGIEDGPLYQEAIIRRAM